MNTISTYSRTCILVQSAIKSITTTILLLIWKEEIITWEMKSFERKRLSYEKWTKMALLEFLSSDTISSVFVFVHPVLRGFPKGIEVFSMVVIPSNGFTVVSGNFNRRIPWYKGYPYTRGAHTLDLWTWEKKPVQKPVLLKSNLVQKHGLFWSAKTLPRNCTTVPKKAIIHAQKCNVFWRIYNSDKTSFCDKMTKQFVVEVC